MEENSPIRSTEAASFKQAIRRRRALVDEWKQQGTERQRQLARTMSRCRRRHRCGLLECPVCQRRKSRQSRTRVAATTSAQMPKSARIQKVAVEDVLVLDKQRECNAERVKELAASMTAIGLRTPITVRRKAGEDRPVLVAGLHRLKAATSLGWKVIDAMIMSDTLAARLWAIAENLHRSELTAMERAGLVRKWVKLIQKLEVSGHNVRKPKGGRPEGGIAKAARDLPVSGKTAEARRKSVERDVKIAGISRKAKAAAKAAGLEDNRTALLKIAKEPTPKAQAAKVQELANEKKKPHAGLAPKDKKKFLRLRGAFVRAREFCRAWRNAPPIVRRLFVSRILKPGQQ
jgi:ParB-like chromosome segregation protein Spo0J